MGMISAPDQEFIRTYFEEKLTDDVTVELFTRPRPRLHVPGQEDCLYCEETRQLLEEVAALSERIELVVHDVLEDPAVLAEHGIEQIPAIVYRGRNRGQLRFFGIPAGNEFRNLIDTLVEVGNGESGLSQQTREALAGLEEDVHLQVFVTPT
jgi:alkyl hydroperoxide reductase subunit AhpF